MKKKRPFLAGEKNIAKRENIVKRKNIAVVAVIALIAVFALVALMFFSDKLDRFVGRAGEQPVPQCSDGIDNDEDGLKDWGFTNKNDPFCSSPFDNIEADKSQTDISWNDFPDFNLHPSLIAVYGGIQLNGCHPGTQICVEDVGTAPLRKGFTHIATFVGLNNEQLASIPPKNRAIGFSSWGGNSGWCEDVKNQPLLKYLLPWNNNLAAFKKCADKELAYFAAFFPDSTNNMPQADILVDDLEVVGPYDQLILDIRKNKEAAKHIPDAFKKLSDQDFLNQYKHDEAWNYNNVIGYPKQRGFKGRISAYGDVPLAIEYGWLYYEDITFDEWTSKEIFTRTCSKDNQWFESCANYVTFNFNNYMAKPGKDFFRPGKLITETLDILTPSGYYAYGYGRKYDKNTWLVAGTQLFTGLFAVDVNTAFSQGKPVIIFRSMRYFTGNVQKDGLPGVDPWMAHATAIFTYFTKNAGQYLWDYMGFDVNVKSPAQTSENRIAYDNFIYGLYRLSRYKQFFEGDYKTYHPIDGRELSRMAGKGQEKKATIWRGIIKEDGTQMLVAAYNPFADFNEATKFQIICPPDVAACKKGDVLDEVETMGLNVWLGVCDLAKGGCVGDEGGKVAKCGNGLKELGEQCDDGNKDDTDSCLNNCKNAICGDGFKGPGEQCDDGNKDDTDSCLNSCVNATCGDGYVQGGVEQCDDGNNITEPFCFYGIPTCTICNADCSAQLITSGPYCGDKKADLEYGETCDDGNLVNGDGCDRYCKLEAPKEEKKEEGKGLNLISYPPQNNVYKTNITATTDLSGVELTAYTVLKDVNGTVLTAQSQKIPGMKLGESLLISLNYPDKVASKTVIIYDKLPNQGGKVFVEINVEYKK
ncbi:MAG: DUF4215 domain-containing protein [Nanoarchaeota archaeon]